MWEQWQWPHAACILRAWLAIAISLFVLGWSDVSEGFEPATRGFTAFFAAVASTILAFDVFNQR